MTANRPQSHCACSSLLACEDYVLGRAANIPYLEAASANVPRVPRVLTFIHSPHQPRDVSRRARWLGCLLSVNTSLVIRRCFAVALVMCSELLLVSTVSLGSVRLRRGHSANSPRPSNEDGFIAIGMWIADCRNDRARLQLQFSKRKHRDQNSSRDRHVCCVQYLMDTIYLCRNISL